jgi:plasmid replication initiation protein
MENPFLSLSKNRKTPIIYESPDGTRKIKVTRHTGHFLASIYDWDIVLFVAGKMQEILNNRSDIPPRSMVFLRHEILEALHKHNVKKQQKDLENSLQRLKRTAIDTTIRNEDYRYKSDFGFVDSWEYTERKDKKEIKITLSQWLYDGICAKGTLLKVSPEYFYLTSALKRFLYRTARKHVGNQKESWEFSIEKLYEKSGSEREFRKFKGDLKAAVLENNIPDYSMKWVERNGKTLVAFRDAPSQKIAELIEEFKDSEDFIECSTDETLH